MSSFHRRPTAVSSLFRHSSSVRGLFCERLEGREVPSVVLVGNSTDQANDGTTFMDASGDGRFVLFASTATNLFTGQQDTTGTPDLFWQDTKLGTTKLVSAKTGTNGLKTLGDFNREAALSFDGLSVVFGSTVSPDYTWWNLSKADAVTPTVRMVTDTTAKVANPTISDDGQFVGYVSDQSDIFRRDMSNTNIAMATKSVTLQTNKITVANGDYMSGDGRYFVYSMTDLLIRDMNAGVLSISANATDAIIARNGSRIAFTGSDESLSIAANPFLSLSIVPQRITGAGRVDRYELSGDGKVLAFDYDQTDLSGIVDANANFDVFTYTIANGAKNVVSVTRDGTTGNIGSFLGNISDDGRFVAFSSVTDAARFSTHVTDTNGIADAFVRDLTNNLTRVVSTGPMGATANGVFGSMVYFTTPNSQLFRESINPNGLKQPEPGLGVIVTNGGNDGTVIVYRIGSDSKTSVISTMTPFSGFTGAVRTASGDIDGDGIADYVLGAGPGGGPAVKVISGANKTEIRNFLAFEASFTGGVLVAVGDFNQDGFDDIVISADNGGGPRVRVISGKDSAQFVDFLSIEDSNFRGGTRPSVGDVNGDGIPDLFVGAGFGGGPRVALYDGNSISSGSPVKFFGDFFIFESTLRNGAYSAVGDLNGDGFGELIAGGGPGGGPRVFAVSGADLLSSNGRMLTPVANFFAGNSSTQGGVRVSAKDTDGDTLADLVTGLGVGATATLTTFRGTAIQSAGPNATPESLELFTPFSGLTGINVV